MAVPQPQPGTMPGFHVAIRSGRRYSAAHQRRLPIPFRPAGGLPKQPPTGWSHIVVFSGTASQLTDSQRQDHQ
jgi:hypothetical protein